MTLWGIIATCIYTQNTRTKEKTGKHLGDIVYTDFYTVNNRFWKSHKKYH